jgi:hypothetical protein
VLSAVVVPQETWAQTGELRVNGGIMTGLGSGGSPVKPLTSASFSFVKSSFSFGPEVSYAFGEEHIFGIGVVSRLRLSSGGLRPYLVTGLGGNYWKRDPYVTTGLLTGSAGVGVVLATRGGLGLTLETRIHKNLQNYGGGGNWDFVSIAGGVRLGW